jgi:hypothetical protein
LIIPEVVWPETSPKTMDEPGKKVFKVKPFLLWSDKKSEGCAIVW